jgi:Uma2 family endonuclease
MISARQVDKIGRISPLPKDLSAHFAARWRQLRSAGSQTRTAQMTTRLAHAPTQPEAFIAWENRRKARYELIGGEVRLMAGGSRAHDVVAGNILAALHGALRGQDCDVHGSNLKIVSPAGMVTYPDVFVRCGPLADEAIECQDPVVVFEVLSPSTRSEDLVRKRWGYQAIPTLAHLVYVDAARVRIEIATHAPDGRWWSVFLDRLDDTLGLETLGIELAAREIYASTRAADD